MAKFHGKGKPPKRKIRMMFTPTLRKSNVGVIGHPTIKSNVGVIRAKIKKKE